MMCDGGVCGVGRMNGCGVCGVCVGVWVCGVCGVGDDGVCDVDVNGMCVCEDV